MKKYIPSLIFLTIFVPAVIIYYKYSTGKTEKILQQLNAEYPIILINDRVTGTITRVYHGDPEVFNNNPHHAYLTLNDTIKRRVNASYELNKEYLLDDVIKVGDQFVKEPGTDHFYIKKIEDMETSTYVFKLEDDSGYPLKKQLK